MPTKVLIISVIRKVNTILMRKTPDGSPPYKETWYLFGAEATSDRSPDGILKDLVRQQTGIEITIRQKFSCDTEIKNDLDSIQKFFVNLDVVREYQSSNLTLSPGMDKTLNL